MAHRLTRGGLEAETDVLVPALGLGGNLAAYSRQSKSSKESEQAITSPRTKLESRFQVRGRREVHPKSTTQEFQANKSVQTEREREEFREEHEHKIEIVAVIIEENSVSIPSCSRSQVRRPSEHKSSPAPKSFPSRLKVVLCRSDGAQRLTLGLLGVEDALLAVVLLDLHGVCWSLVGFCVDVEG